ncbi:MAG: hypothetical protein Q4G10_07785 [Bacteroidia bacterium]|nr:hypothetical protein [Bacteroidia bacterium]
MRKIVTILCLSLVMAASLDAQNRYRGFVEAGASTIIGEYDGEAYQLSTSQGLKFDNPRIFGLPFYVGLGVGLDTYAVVNPHYDPDAMREDHINCEWCDMPYQKKMTDRSYPFFLNLKWYSEDEQLSPVIDIKGGIALGQYRYGGLFFESGLGCRVPLDRHCALSASAFIRLFNIGYAEDAVIFGNKLNNVGIKVAFEF